MMYEIKDIEDTTFDYVEQFKIATKRVKRKWWFGYRIEYWIVGIYYIGPFKSLSAASSYMANYKIYFNRH